MYRDHLYAARCRRAQLEAQRALVDIPPSVGRVFARRQGRIWAGFCGVLGAALLVVSFALRGMTGLSGLVVASWLSIVAVYIVARNIAGVVFRVTLRRRYRETGDVIGDLARLDSGGPREFAIALTQRLEGPSLAYPLLAISLLAPLSIHLLIAVGLMSVTLGHFDSWIALSMVLVGHAHLTLAAFALMHAKRLRHELDAGLPAEGASRGLVALAWTVGAGALPGLVLVCVPPLLVAATGALFVPWTFHWARSCAVQERAIMAPFVSDSPAGEASSAAGAE